MKKIGILFGMEHSFPQALIERINNAGISGISAEPIQLGSVKMDDIPDYSVILDRVSGEAPYYRTFLKIAALNGTKVINNPFWKCADDNLLHAAIARKSGILVPKTVALPSKERPEGTSAEHFRNMIFPIPWDDIFHYVGFPAFLKSNTGAAPFSDFKVYNPQEFFSAYDLTGNKVMILQESIEYEQYFRCYAVGKTRVRIMSYNPLMPHHLRYSDSEPDIDNALKQKIEGICKKICSMFGFDFNAIEFAVKDGEPYAIDFLNSSPNADRPIIREANFEWLVSEAAEFLIAQANSPAETEKLYNWNEYIKGIMESVPEKKKRSTK